MFLKSQLTWNVAIPAKYLDPDCSMLTRAIVVSIMEQFCNKKSSKDLGYFLAVTTLDSTGEGRISRFSGDLLFSVTFSCITFKMLPGEVLEGAVHKISKLGVFLICGPADKIYLSHTKMPGYHYVSGDQPYFTNESSKIKKGTVLRFTVIDALYKEAENDTQVIAGMDEVFNLAHLNDHSCSEDSSHDDVLA